MYNLPLLFLLEGTRNSVRNVACAFRKACLVEPQGCVLFESIVEGSLFCIEWTLDNLDASAGQMQDWFAIFRRCQPVIQHCLKRTYGCIFRPPEHDSLKHDV